MSDHNAAEKELRSDHIESELKIIHAFSKCAKLLFSPSRNCMVGVCSVFTFIAL